MSYNSRGFCTLKQEFCRLLSSSQTVGNSVPILCNQENFVLRANCYKIRNSLPDFHTIIKPAVKQTLDNGRPKNGMFIAIPNAFKNMLNDVSPAFWRLQAATVDCSSSRIIIINSYFPVDPRTKTFNDSELLETLQHIRNILETNVFNHILWTGDINADFIRRTGHVKIVKEFIDDFSFKASWDKYHVDFTHHHEVNGQSSTSTIDHFFWNAELDGNILDAGVIHHPSNMSDHSPIYCKIDAGKIEAEDVGNQAQAPPKPSWKKSSHEEKDKFVHKLDSLLSQLEVSEDMVCCQDVHCKNEEHVKDTDDLIVAVLESIDKAALESLHQVDTNKSKPKNVPIPGWSENVQHSKETAYFWHQVWQSAERPLNNELHRIMKRSRNIYHYNIRKCKKAENTIRRNKLLDACINGNGDIFNEIKKMRKTKPLIATSMDGNKNQIEDHFKDIYGNLYNSFDDKENITNLLDEVNNGINHSHAYDVQKVTPAIIKEAVKHLKDGKTDPVHVFSSDCFKNAPDILFKLLSVVVKSFLIHGHVTIYLLLATLVPIVKNKLTSINISKNYRSIAISSLVLKILDWVILTLFGESLGLDDLQFA